MGNNKVALIPYWVRDSLWRTGHKIEDLLDFNKVSQFLSRDEAGILEALQSPKCQELVFGAVLGDHGFSFVQHWQDSLHPTGKTELGVWCNHFGNNDYGAEILLRLFDTTDFVTTSVDQLITEVRGFGVAVTVMPNLYCGENHQANSNAISREVCKTLYKYECMGTLMSAPFGRRFIETLSR